MKKEEIYKDNLSELKEMISRAEYLKYTLGSLIYWDKITYMPPKGIEYRTRVMAFLADEQYKILSAERFEDLVSYFDGNEANDEKVNAMIKRIKRNAFFSSSIPEEEYSRYIRLIAVSEQIWEKARNDNDFELFRPYLEEIFHTFKTFSSYWGGGDDPYDALMGYYEEGLTVKRIDQMVGQLKPFLTGLVSAIKDGRQDAAVKRPSAVNVNAGDQQLIWKIVLETMGFDFSAGRIDMGAHPTVLANSPSDVRIVNSYRENDMEFGLFNVLHSGGKGIYQQSIDEGLLGSFLAEAPSFAMEESIGRFYENIIGRSRGFVSKFRNELGVFLPAGSKLTAEQIYRDINLAKPSAIRIEADQFTYLLHIIIRYEIEKDVINGRLAVGDIPAAWNDKYREYLGVAPENDREGVLQDIHWAGGYVGYFPSYIVACLGAVQIKAAMEKDLGDLDQLAETGRFDMIKNWLDEKIFRCGAIYSTRELIQKATGGPLEAEHYMDYLRKKFSEVYKFEIISNKEKEQ